MNKALWSRAIADARAMVLACMAVLFAFNWLFVWLTSKIDLRATREFVNQLPDFLKALSPIPIDELLSYSGRIGLAYVDPVVLFTLTVWGIGRGSDSVSGELGRGTMEMLVAQPVRRSSVLLVQACVTTCGGALLALSCWLGTWAGLTTVTMPDEVQIPASLFMPAAGNLFGLAFFLAGATTLISACDRYRGRTIGIAGGFYIVSLILKIIGRMAPDYDWLIYASFLGAFEPVLFVNQPQRIWELTCWYDGTLFGLGVLGYTAACVVFCRRDLPAPL